MKLPIVLTIIILAAGSFWGVRESRVLTTLREKHRQVVHEATSLGISADASKPLTQTKASKRQREDSSKKTKDFANTLVAFAKEMEEMEKSGQQPDADMQKRIMEMVDGMLSLNGEELKILIAEMRGRTDLDDEMRKNMIGFSIMMLAQQHPQTALAIFTESSDLMEDNPMSKHVLSSALSQWAKDQPLEALEWIKKNAEKHPDLVTDDAKRAVIVGTAEKDYGLAFQLAAEIKLSTSDDSLMTQMARAAVTPEQQRDFLTALRKQAANMADKTEGDKFMASGMSHLFSQVSESGFDKTMEWMKTANLSPGESANLAEGLNYHTTKADTGKWLDWVSSQPADEEKSKNTTRNLVRNWTERDFKAAGEWLAESPAGPLKETATLSYLETVAPYDPDVAAQWAQTLTGDGQSNAMKRIHEKLKQKDKPAAEEFARRHGIQSE
jgi:hypothetical protein